MRTTFLTMGALALSLLGTGCIATHKYVAKTIAPIEQRVGTDEAKNDSRTRIRIKRLATHRGDRGSGQGPVADQGKAARPDNKATQAAKLPRRPINTRALHSSPPTARNKRRMALAPSRSRLTKLDKNTKP
jgi:hypothetical protein